MSKPLRRVKRKIRSRLPATDQQRSTRTAVRFIMDNHHYNDILAAIRSGTPDSAIAEHFIARGIFDVNQKTAVGYLRHFRKAQQVLCTPREGRLAGYDHLFSGTGSVADPETELVRLIQLQKSRLGISFDNERSVNLLMAGGRREVQELRELIMELARLRGIVGKTMDINFTNYGEGVRADLKGIQQDEGQRDTIATMMAELAKTVSDYA